MRLDRVAAYDTQLVRGTRHDPNIQAEPEEPTLGLLPENAWAERGARIETQPCIVDNFGADTPINTTRAPMRPRLVEGPRFLVAVIDDHSFP